MKVEKTNKISITITPNAKQDIVTEDILDFDGNRYIKIKTKKPAIDGKANSSIIEILANYLKCKRKDIKIISGEFSRKKIVSIPK